MWPDPQFPVEMITFTEEILNRNLHFLCSTIKPLIVAAHIHGMIKYNLHILQPGSEIELCYLQYTFFSWHGT